MKSILLPLAAAITLMPGAAVASELVEGMWIGSIITTCQYLENDVFRQRDFGVHMIEQQYQELTPENRRHVVGLWREEGLSRCIHATHGH